MDLIQILDKYGLTILIILYTLTNAKGIFKALKPIFTRLVPSWTDKKTLEERHRVADAQQSEKERVDTIRVQKDMLIALRAEIDIERQERREVQKSLYEFMRGYERLSAQNIEVTRELSALIRTDLERVKELVDLVRTVVKELNDGRGTLQ